MLKTLLAAAALVTVAAAPANAGFTLNGFTLNGITLNGFTLNGFTLNGVQFQGVQFNGMRLGPIGMNVGGHGGASLNGQVIAIEL
jgi:uncharacterized protein YjbI with pentapeptide repeats